MRMSGGVSCVMRMLKGYHAHATVSFGWHMGYETRDSMSPFTLYILHTLHFTFYTLPARWRVLCAALRRAIASRKAVPADIKDQTSRPLRGKTKIVCHIPPTRASGILGS